MTKPPDVPPPTFSEQLFFYRMRLDLSQAKAAELLGIGERTYAIWERDDDPNRKPHILTQEGALKRLADAVSKLPIQPDK
jgi:transcriptional regulator with XRE-family HTH domain